MNDRHIVPLETTDGARTAASGSERVLIGLALLALFGAVLIIISNLVGVDLEASASGSPKPSIRATTTPKPTRSPAPRRQMILEPGEPSSPAEEPNAAVPLVDQSYWIRADEELYVRGSRSVTSVTAYTIPAGSAALVSDAGSFDDDLGWVILQGPNPGYWVATRADGRDLVTRYGPELAVQSGWVAGLAAGPGGFVATGLKAGSWDQPLDVVLASRDGAAWDGATDWVRSFGSPQGGSVTSVAWGPAGWLVLTSMYDRSSNLTWIHRSDDGVAWEALGRIPSRYESLAGASVVASAFGYVLTNGWGNVGEVWFSTDGVAWREMGAVPGPRGASTSVTAIPDGFLAMRYLRGYGPSQLVGAAFSIDGRTWTEVVGGPAGFAPRIVNVGDRVIGMDNDAAGGAVRVWVGSISRGILTWRRAPGADAAFEGGLVTALTSDGARAYAFGLDRATQRPVAWVGDGINWIREALPGQFEGVPSAAAAGPMGVVVVGSRPTMRGDNPIFWHRTQGGDWQPERSPVIEVAPDRPPDCGSPPADLFELQARDRISVIACFGDAPISFRAWSAPCGWCGLAPDPQFTPSWLAWGQGSLSLSLVDGHEGEYQVLDGVLPPSLPLQPEWVGRWVEVTGHFDDPAALTCAYDTGDDAGYFGNARVVNECRQRFVIDAVAVVEGP